MARVTGIVVASVVALLACSTGGTGEGAGEEVHWGGNSSGGGGRPGEEPGDEQRRGEPGLPPCEADEDGDGFGVECLAGPDCDEGNPWLNIYCPPCEYGIYQGCPCSNPGALVECFPDDPDYLGVGECKAGKQSCDDGHWGPCLGAVEPLPELCDGVDNDCDGEVDEGVKSVCGGCDPQCNHVGAGPGKVYGFALDEKNSSGVSENADGFIVLDSKNVNIQYIWIANSAENTVSKIHTGTGKEEGRYDVCSNPSRTAVDLYGDVWVGCRNDGGVAKIGVHELACVDKNNDGTIQTSKDLNGDGKISGDELYPAGADECVRFVVNPGGSCQRGLGVDKENHAWVGEWSSKVLRRLHPDDGQVVKEISIPANPYGLVIDKQGIIWVSGRGGNLLVRVDPASGAVSSHSPGGSFEPYGITLDNKGRVWTANCCSEHVANRYDPQSGSWAKAATAARPRGLVGTADGRVFVANDMDDKVAVIVADTLQTVGYVHVGGGRFPLGMAVDFDGFIWAVNQNASSTVKIDPKTLAVVGEYPTGSGPYTYSDMTGYLLHTFTNPTGYYQHLFGGWGKRLRWTGLIVDAYLPAQTSIKVRLRSASDLASLEEAEWTEQFGPFPPQTFPLDLLPYDLYGHYLQVEVALFSEEDGVTPIVKGIEIEFDNG